MIQLRHFSFMYLSMVVSRTERGIIRILNISASIIWVDFQKMYAYYT